MTADESAILLTRFILRLFKDRKTASLIFIDDSWIIQAIFLVDAINWKNFRVTGTFHAQISPLDVLTTLRNEIINRVFLLPLFDFRPSNNIRNFAPGFPRVISFLIFLLYLKWMLQPIRAQLPLFKLSLYLVLIVPIMRFARGAVIHRILGQSAMNPDRNCGGLYSFVLVTYAVLFWVISIKTPEVIGTRRKAQAF